GTRGTAAADASLDRRAAGRGAKVDAQDAHLLVGRRVEPDLAAAYDDTPRLRACAGRRSVAPAQHRESPVEPADDAGKGNGDLTFSGRLAFGGAGRGSNPIGLAFTRQID